MARLTPRFSTNRTVHEYIERHYLPAAVAYRGRAADKGAAGMQVVNWQHALEQKWAMLHFGEVTVETNREQHVFEVQLYFADLDPDAVRVELYADGTKGGAPVRQEMMVRPATGRGARLRLSSSGVRYTTSYGLHSASDSPLLRRSCSAGSRPDPLAKVRADLFAGTADGLSPQPNRLTAAPDLMGTDLVSVLEFRACGH